MTSDVPGVRDVRNARDTRDPQLPGKLLATERDALMPLLRARPADDFALPTACPGWTVRHVLAHCAAALTRVVEGRFEKGVFSPEANDRDIAERADLPLGEVLDELEQGMTDAGPLIAADERLDGIALGEWVHAGDVRAAFGESGAYGGAGLPHALTLLGAFSRAKGLPALHADLDDADEPLLLGAPAGDVPPARYLGDGATLVRIYAGRPLEGAGYELVGVDEEALRLFR